MSKIKIAKQQFKIVNLNENINSHMYQEKTVTRRNTGREIKWLYDCVKMQSDEPCILKYGGKIIVTDCCKGKAIIPLIFNVSTSMGNFKSSKTYNFEVINSGKGALCKYWKQVTLYKGNNIYIGDSQWNQNVYIKREVVESFTTTELFKFHVEKTKEEIMKAHRSIKIDIDYKIESSGITYNYLNFMVYKELDEIKTDCIRWLVDKANRKYV